MNESNENLTRRARRLQQKHSHKVRLTTVVIAIVVGLAAVAFVVVGTFRLTQSDNASAKSVTTFPSFVKSTQTGEKERALTPENPLRLWIAGDSLAGAFGASLSKETADTGIVQPQFDSRPSSGLTSPSFFNWPQHAQEQLTALNPEVVVFIIGANDTGVVTRNSDTWKADYKTKVDTMMNMFTQNNRKVYWVGAPIMRDDKFSARVVEVNKVFQEEAKSYPNVTYIDAYKVFSNDQGKYSKQLPDSIGKTVTVRTDDGIHLTSAGGDRLADVIFELLDAKWQLNLQAVPDHPKPIIQTKGSGRIAGSGSSSKSSGSKSSSGSSGSNSTTTSTNSSSTTTGTGSTSSTVAPSSTTGTTSATSSPPTTS